MEINKKMSWASVKKLSVARWYDPVVSTLVVLLSYSFLSSFNISNVQLVLAITLLATCYMFSVEVFRNQDLWDKQKRVEVKKAYDKRVFIENVFTKYLGILFGVLLILFFYWLIPEYQNFKYTETIREAKYIFLPFFLPISFLLVLITEYLLGEKKDGTYNMGLFASLQFKKINWATFRDGLLEWLVRLVFLTLNLTTAVMLVGNLRTKGMPFVADNFALNVIGLEAIIFLTLLFTILPGYVFSSRLINTQVKKIDSTWFAWVITLICYQPFIQPIFGNIVKYGPDLSLYNGSPVWVALAQNIPFLLYGLGIFIVLSAFVHLWAEAIIGIRSSNLTNRGIITNGPFKYTKHPVYVSKCFGWGFAVLPFVNSFNTLDSIRLGILFCLMCGIFIGRSIAEERYLAQDEDYVKYALYVDKYGVFAWIGRLIPCMSFSWRYKYWKYE